MVDESNPSKKRKLGSGGQTRNHFVNYNPDPDLPTTQPSSNCKKLCTAHCTRSSPTTPAIQDYHKKDEGSKEAVGPRGVKRKLSYDDASEDQLTVSSTETTSEDTTPVDEHLKQLSEIIDTIEGSCPDLIGPVSLLDLFSPPSGSKSKDGCKKATRGVMLLKEGLSILTEAKHLLTVVDDSEAEK
ncbi:uncharacterized protein LOC103959572 [Pyrus x bretschneideri]|uniref:uncharacterized protein LOC103959572 n=1 Tax=Pyrus x bretschneideri TaxID=225117 RepID=UPI0005115466|nr:uncharacterized protein LOC103959572 [Pyrus x bretschneideri]